MGVVLDELPPPDDAEDVIANVSSAVLSSGSSSKEMDAGKSSDAEVVVDDLCTTKSDKGEIVVDDLHVPGSNATNPGVLVSALAKNDVPNYETNGETSVEDVKPAGAQFEKMADLSDVEEPESCRCCQ